MAIQEMSLPVDVAWRRLAASADMMDKEMQDSALPPRWRSSLAIFYADAVETDQYCDRIITYIKVVCTITGYQIGENELGYGFVPPSLERPTSERPVNVAIETVPGRMRRENFLTYVARAEGRRGSLWAGVSRSLGVGRASKLATLSRTFELSPGQRLRSSADEITRSVQLREGHLREAPFVSVAPHAFTVQLKPAHGVKLSGQLSYIATDIYESWGTQTINNFRETVGAYRPCHGAMLQVTVYPGKKDENVALDDYPYVVAFEPKKRELYEAVTDSGESLSASNSNINVRKGTTTTSETENSDVFTGFGQEVKVFGTGGTTEVSGEWGTRARAGTENVNVTTTDASREKRESLAHTTSLTQLYTLLNSYHLATNRSLFLMLPRPHQRQQFFTYANGIRELEGVQEFFFVVSRPKSVKGLCVSALLETAHVIDEERSRVVGEEQYGYRTLDHAFDLYYTGKGWTEKIVQVNLPDGYKLDWDGNPPALVIDFATQAYDDFPCTYEVVLGDYLVQVKVSMYDDNNEEDPTRALGTVRVKCKTIDPIETPIEERWIESDLIITGRRVGGCVVSTRIELPEHPNDEQSDEDASGEQEGDEEEIEGSPTGADGEEDMEASPGHPHPQTSEPLGNENPRDGDSLTFETTIPVTDERTAETRLGNTIRTSNLMIARIGHAMVESIGSPARYKLGERRIGEAQYIARQIARSVAGLSKHHPANAVLSDKDFQELGVQRQVVERIRELGIRSVSDLARNLRVLENAVREPASCRALQSLILKVAGIQSRESK